jgi:hypothetical protein
MQRALESSSSIVDERRRARALSSLAPHLPSELMQRALESASAIVDERWRARVLGSLATHLAAHLDHENLYLTFHWLAIRGRPAFLIDLAALTPWLVALATPEELTEIAIAIRDVARCWP